MTAVAWCGRNRTGLVYLVIFGGLILIIVLASIKGDTEDQEAAPWYASESYASSPSYNCSLPVHTRSRHALEVPAP